MILVTGAAGQTGQAVLRALARRGVAARALVSRDASVATVRAAGAREVVLGDLRSDTDVRAALHGVARVLHICPVMSDAEVPIGRRVIDAARAGGVAQFVFHSLVHSQCDGLPHHADKRRVEEMLIEQPMPFTILRPAMYLQNLLREWDAIVRDGVWRAPYSVQVPMNVVDLADVAEATAVVLSEDGWSGGEFELCSGERPTRTQMADALAEVLGRPVRAERIELAAWRTDALRVRDTFQVDRVATMFAHYDRFGLTGGNARVLAMLLGRKPGGLRAFVRRVAIERGALAAATEGRG